MRILPAVLIVQSVIGAASAALRPFETDIRPVDNKAAAEPAQSSTPPRAHAYGFFNRFPDSPWHALVLRQIDVFLTSLGCLKGNATVEVPADIAVALHNERL
jgi:hypothetical protein